MIEPDLEALSRQLGVPASSVRRLGIGWDGDAWTFPMFDGDARPIGLHRRFSDGRKVCLKGSRLGLFLSTVTTGGNGNRSLQDAKNEVCVTAAPLQSGLALPRLPLLICEGATDTAAALALGYEAIGVPSTGQGADLVVTFLRRTPSVRVVIVADLDESCSAKDGKIGWPGIEGALALATRLMPVHGHVHFCLPPPGVKDLRQWLQRDERNVIRAAVEAAPHVNPRWMKRARQNVFENRRSRSEPSWSQRAAALLARIADAELRAGLREQFEERAGIIEHEGNLPRDEAERLAFETLSLTVRELNGSG